MYHCQVNPLVSALEYVDRSMYWSVSDYKYHRFTLLLQVSLSGHIVQVNPLVSTLEYVDQSMYWSVADYRYHPFTSLLQVLLFGHIVQVNPSVSTLVVFGIGHNFQDRSSVHLNDR